MLTYDSLTVVIYNNNYTKYTNKTFFISVITKNYIIKK